MAELLGAMSAVVGMVQATEKLLSKIRNFRKAIREVPEVIISVRAQVALWKTQLEEVHELSQRSSSNAELRDRLVQTDVLKDARSCLERLSFIVAELTPDQVQGRVSSIRDRVTFHRQYESEVETLLKRMDKITQHLDFALAMFTKFVPRSFHAPLDWR